MARAKTVALALARMFFEEGSFDAAKGIAPEEAEGIVPAASTEDMLDTVRMTQGFHGLAVQAVGYAETGENPGAYVYLTKGHRAATKRVPEAIDDVQIHLRWIGRLTIRPETAAAASTQGRMYFRNGRIACGSSCAPATEKIAGTLGALVSKSGKLHIISNNHVIAACNQLARGQHILSPSAIDSRANLPGARSIARLEDAVQLHSGHPSLFACCQLDAAIAAVEDSDVLTSIQGEGPEAYDTPPRTVAATPGLAVKKFGRTTEFTCGTVESVAAAPTPIWYQSSDFKGVVWMEAFFIVETAPGQPTFALRGDSGSLIVSDDGSAAAGLLFACGRTQGMGIELDPILRHFGVTLVHGHGV